MKNRLSIALLVTFIIGTARSQESSTDMQLPGNPSTAILGIANSEISKPGNYTGLYSQLMVPLVTANGAVPRDLGLEFSPYYLRSRASTINELWSTNLYRDLRLSVASTGVSDSLGKDFSRIGIGARTHILSGTLSEEKQQEIQQDAVQNIANEVASVKDAIATEKMEYVKQAVQKISDDDARKKVEKIVKKNEGDWEDMKVEVTRFVEKLNEKINKDGSLYNLSMRTGHFLEIAGATTLDFPENTVDYSKLARWGIWLNYVYRPSEIKWKVDLGVLVRLSNYSFDPMISFGTDALFFDFGGNLSFDIPGTSWSVSSELIGKLGASEIQSTGNENEFVFKGVAERKWNVTVGYEVTPNTMVNFSFGDVDGSESYLNDNTTQVLLGVSMALAAMKGL